MSHTPVETFVHLYLNEYYSEDASAFLAPYHDQSY